MKAIITGDVVLSSLFSSEIKENVLKSISKLFENHNGRMEIYRGDSFQGLLNDPLLALEIVYQIRMYTRLLAPKTNDIMDCRLAIGIGTIDHESEKVLQGDGPAYRNSGPYLDNMQKDERVVCITPWKRVNDELETEIVLAEALVRRWTRLQVEVLIEAMNGENQLQIAKKLNITQSAVNQRLMAASWNAIHIYLIRYKQIIREHLNK